MKCLHGRRKYGLLLDSYQRWLVVRLMWRLKMASPLKSGWGNRYGIQIGFISYYCLGFRLLIMAALVVAHFICKTIGQAVFGKPTAIFWGSKRTHLCCFSTNTSFLIIVNKLNKRKEMLILVWSCYIILPNHFWT